MMLISLYTTRIVLATLGVEDYGVYNVVGGMVSMFGILSASLSTAISRFITFSLGKGDKEELQRVFSTAIIIQTAMAILIGLLIELIGVWYLFNKMVIPDGRMTAAFWVLQCGIVHFGLGLFSVPFNAEIIAHEKMSVFAYLSIADAILALVIVFILRILPYDKLILYAAMTVMASILMRTVYAIYCRIRFEECRFRFSLEKRLLKEMGAFAGWNLLGQGTWILNTQGVDLLVNSFFGVTMNAARGVAGQVNNALVKFANSFMTAVDPQITKTYAEGNLHAMHTLIFRATRMAMYLMYLFAIPFIIDTPYILGIWLKEVPDHAVLFTRLTILFALIIQLGQTLVKAQLATGNIKKYQIIISLGCIWVLPLTWVAYRQGLPVEWCYFINVAIYFLLIFLRVYLVKDLIHLPVKFYYKRVLLRVLLVLILAIPLPVLTHYFLTEGFIRLIIVCFVSTLSLGIVIYFIGIEKEERAFLNEFVRSKLSIVIK